MIVIEKAHFSAGFYLEFFVLLHINITLGCEPPNVIFLMDFIAKNARRSHT